LDDQFDDDDDEDDEDAALFEDMDDDESVLALLATFEVPALGHAYDMMRVEQVYQLIAKKGPGDQGYVLLDEGESDLIRPRVAETLARYDECDDGGECPPGLDPL